MAAKKAIITLNILPVSVLEAYAAIDAKIKILEESKAQLAEEIKAAVLNYTPYDYDAKYDLGGILKTSHRIENSLDQLKTFEAMKKPKVRDLLFPTAVAFKPGSDKNLADQHGLLVRSYSANPVIEIIKR